MTVYLIRHGLTAANEKHLYCGKTDLPLSENGKKALSPALWVDARGCRMVTSGLLRTNETLTHLFGSIPYEVIPQLQEMDFGVFEMHSYAQLQNDPAYIQWISGDNHTNIAPGGESGEIMCTRALCAFQKILAQGEDTAIITHGGVIAAIMAHLFPSEQKNRYQWQCTNGSGYKLLFSQGVWSYENISDRDP